MFRTFLETVIELPIIGVFLVGAGRGIQSSTRAVVVSCRLPLSDPISKRTTAFCYFLPVADVRSADSCKIGCERVAIASPAGSRANHALGIC